MMKKEIFLKNTELKNNINALIFRNGTHKQKFLVIIVKVVDVQLATDTVTGCSKLTANDARFAQGLSLLKACVMRRARRYAEGASRLLHNGRRVWEVALIQD